MPGGRWVGGRLGGRPIGQRGAGGGGVENFRVDVGAVGPANRAELGIHPDPREVSGFAKRSEDSLERHHRRDVDIALGTVVEPEAQSVSLENLDAPDVVKHGHGSAARTIRAGSVLMRWTQPPAAHTARVACSSTATGSARPPFHAASAR